MAVIYATSLFMRSKGIPIRAIIIQNILVRHKFVFANPISHILYITITSRPLTISTTFINIHKMRYSQFHDNNAKQQHVSLMRTLGYFSYLSLLCNAFAHSVNTYYIVKNHFVILPFISMITKCSTPTRYTFTNIHKIDIQIRM